MANYEWIEKNSKKILYMNIACKSLEELDGRIKEFRTIIDTQPKESLLTITDTQDGHFNKAMSNAINMFAEANKPYIKMTVIIGIEGLKKVIYDGVIRLTGRKNMIIKNTKEEAIEFLAAL